MAGDSGAAAAPRSFLALQTSHRAAGPLRQRAVRQLSQQYGNQYVNRAAEHEWTPRPQPSRHAASVPLIAGKSGAAQIQRQEEGPSPEAEFLDDMISGIEKSTEYMSYITDAVDYWKEYGGPQPGNLLRAAENLARITKRISDGLDEFAKPLKLAKQALEIKEWATKALDFANKTAALDITDKASRDAWIQSTEAVSDASKPFLEAGKSWLAAAATKGSIVAARASVVLSVFTAYAEVGWAALKAGIKAVETYTARFGYEGSEMRKIEEAETGKRRREEPGYPGDWTSAAEMRVIWARMESDRLRRAKLAPFQAKLREAETRLSEAQSVFDEKTFKKVYIKRRGKLLYRVLREMKVGKKVWTQTMEGVGSASARGLGEGKWWECFIDSGEDTYFDRLAGIYIAPKKQAVNLEQAEWEIDNFRSVGPTCPFFNDIYTEELAKFTAKQRAAVVAAEAELDKAASETK